MNKRLTVRAMYAAKDCIARLEAGKPLPTGLLRSIAYVVGDDTEWLMRHDRSALCAPVSPEQRSAAIEFLADVMDDCRFMLRECPGAVHG